MWAMKNFIHTQGRRWIEDIGREYLDELCSRSLLQILSNNEVEMHDFFHNLAMSVSTNLCLALEDTMSAKSSSFLSQNARHLSLLCQSIQSDVSAAKLEESYRYQKLRTFMLFFHVNPLPRTFFELKIFAELFEKFEWLRILNLSGSGIHKLSDSIENFKYLWCWFNCWKLWFGCHVSRSERDSDAMPPLPNSLLLSNNLSSNSPLFIWFVCILIFFSWRFWGFVLAQSAYVYSCSKKNHTIHIMIFWHVPQL